MYSFAVEVPCGRRKIRARATECCAWRHCGGTGCAGGGMSAKERDLHSHPTKAWPFSFLTPLEGFSVHHGFYLEISKGSGAIVRSFAC